jgi:hypothetical protein
MIEFNSTSLVDTKKLPAAEPAPSQSRKMKAISSIQHQASLWAPLPERKERGAIILPEDFAISKGSAMLLRVNQPNLVSQNGTVSN